MLPTRLLPRRSYCTSYLQTTVSDLAAVPPRASYLYLYLYLPDAITGVASEAENSDIPHIDLGPTHITNPIRKSSSYLQEPMDCRRHIYVAPYKNPASRKQMEWDCDSSVANKAIVLWRRPENPSAT